MTWIWIFHFVMDTRTVFVETSTKSTLEKVKKTYPKHFYTVSKPIPISISKPN